MEIQCCPSMFSSVPVSSWVQIHWLLLSRLVLRMCLMFFFLIRIFTYLFTSFLFVFKLHYKAWSDCTDYSINMLVWFHLDNAKSLSRDVDDILLIVNFWFHSKLRTCIKMLDTFLEVIRLFTIIVKFIHNTKLLITILFQKHDPVLILSA